MSSLYRPASSPAPTVDTSGGVGVASAAMGSQAMQDAANRTARVAAKLKEIYKRSVLPLEKKYQYDYFYDSPFLSDVEFDAKPQVLLIGQYSVGKTSFIRYLLGRDFPGQRIGPEPTTDRFTVLINGPEERTIPGNALSVHPDMPFRGLDRFGVSFLSRFEGSQVPSTVLKSITLIDTPGILAGKKQEANRGYEFTKVVSWFAERADLIILLFDAHKLDISDELKNAIDALKGHEDKVRCILNKADQIDRQQLMRVYGALLWSLGKTISTPEVTRVYVGSFWSQPLQTLDNAQLFEDEEKDLMKDFAILPRQSAVRKVNELVKRIRKVKTLAYIIGYLKSQMPNMMGKDKKQAKLISELPSIFRIIVKKYNLSPGDFPDLNTFTSKLKDVKFSEFSSLSPSLIDGLDKALNKDIPRLMEDLPSERDTADVLKTKMNTNTVPIPSTSGKYGPSYGDPISNPFGAEQSDEDNYWALLDSAERLLPSFEGLNPVGGFLSPDVAKDVLMRTGLAKDQLRKIWNLSDMDRDGHFDHHEYVVAMFLCDAVIQKGRPIPDELPASLIPPSKRAIVNEQNMGKSGNLLMS
mmetsp:Transcript_11423/g.22658  ORF Transcript_11423/g.22658 Transcript_11423/m.22658 type:complete len:582 (+) Transcript_11423:310-2055(+)